MAHLNYSVPTIGDPNSSEDIDLREALIQLKDLVNGDIDRTNLIDDFPFLSAGTTFPVTPYDGQFFCYNADTTNGVKWMFQYRSASASAYKWEFIGGSPLYEMIATDQSTTSTTFVDLSTVGPSVTIPITGDYYVEIGCRMINSSTNALGYMSYAIGGTSATDFLALDQAEGSSGNTSLSGSRLNHHGGVTSTSLIRAKYRTSTGTGFFKNRWIRVIPTRV